jgi:hypothetical protein
MSKRLDISITMLALTVGISLAGLAETETVTINAQIGAQLVFNMLSGECVILSVDPLNAPSANGTTVFEVKTNAVSYAISAAIGSFIVGSYDLIANANYHISSDTTGDGQAIGVPVVPPAQLDILIDESGGTASELTTIYYQLDVDYTVPWGNALEDIIFTATPVF